MKFARIIAATACVFALMPVAQSEAATRTVDIPGRYFQPQRVTINVGDTIFWVNSSKERHSVRSDSNESFRSSTNCPGGLLGNDCLRPGATYSHTFSRRGTFAYYCERHGSDAKFPNCGMCGRVSVVRKSTGTVAPTTPGSATPTSTVTSPSPSADLSASPSVSVSSTPPVAAGPDGDGSTSIVAIAAAAVVLLGGSGYLIYRTMIRS